ncbi:MAG: SPFH domain-containing protein [Phycisphaeraceae bacterium]
MAEQMKNPFTHQHDEHEHDHVHGDHQHNGDAELLQDLDPAQQSLADALRVSFTILKVIMVLLLAAYLFSGVFRVEENMRAVRLRFGAIVGDEMTRVHEPGWYFGWPYPIEQKLHIPVSPRSVSTGDAFWYEVTARDLAQEMRPMRPLNPERDGSLLTGDANIVHGRFSATYSITDPALFVENVGLAQPGSDRLPDGTPARHALDFADLLVRSAAEQGIIFAVAQVEADDFIDGRMNRGLAVMRTQEVLDALNAGITVNRMEALNEQMPQPVYEAYQAVVRAESERGETIDAARQERARLLGQTAGPAHEGLYAMIRAYEAARDANDADTAATALAQIDEAMATLHLPAEHGAAPVRGDVAGLINEAIRERTAVVERIQAEAHTFQSLLPEYRARPHLFTTRLWQDAKETILTGDIETFYTMGGHFYPVLSRDPAIQREREQRQIIDQQQRQQQQR